MNIRNKKGMILAALLLAACAQLAKDDTSDESGKVEENKPVVVDERLKSEDPNERQAAARDQIAERENQRLKILAAYADPKSAVYSDPASHRVALKKIAANDPVRFQRILANVNNLREIRGKKRLSAKDLAATPTQLNLQPIAEQIEIQATADENLGACLASRIGPPKLAPLPALSDAIEGEEGEAGGAEADAAPAWDPSQPCPDRCVCAAAHAFAYAEAYAEAYAQCSDGSFGYGYGEGFAYAEAWAYAYACLPPDDDDPGACEEDPGEPPVGDPCGEIDEDVVDPFVVIIGENPDCFLNDGGEGNCTLTPDPPVETDGSTDDGIETSTAETDASDPAVDGGADETPDGSDPGTGTETNTATDGGLESPDFSL